MKKLAILALACATAAAMLFTTAGCETEKLSDAQLTISPSEVTVAPGQTVKFTAHGGWVYTWATSNGTLSSRSGESVVYTAPATGSTNTASTATITVNAASNLTATAVITIK